MKCPGCGAFWRISLVPATFADTGERVPWVPLQRQAILSHSGGCSWGYAGDIPSPFDERQYAVRTAR